MRTWIDSHLNTIVVIIIILACIQAFICGVSIGLVYPKIFSWLQPGV